MAVVTRLAERLVIIFFPEKMLVAAMRLDMIDDRCRDDLTHLHAGGAERMTAQVSLTVSLPAGAIPARCSRGAFFHRNKKPVEAGS